MYKYAPCVDEPNAFFVVIDRPYLRTRPSAALIWNILHKSQRPYFEAWASGAIGLPILVFGRVSHRDPASGCSRTELKICCFHDAAAVSMFLSGHSIEAKLQSPKLIRCTAYCAFLSDANQARELQAALSALPGVSEAQL